MSLPTRLALALALATSATAAAEPVLVADQLIVVKPEAGAPTIGKWKPSFCGRVVSENTVARQLGRMIASSLFDHQERAIAAMCVAPDDAVFQEQVGYYLQAWANLTGQTATELDEYFSKLANPERWRREHEATCKRVAIGEEASEREQTLGAMTKAVLGCGYEAQTGTPYHFSGTAPNSLNHMLWHFDRSAEVPSQLTAIYRVLECARGADPDDAADVMHFAPCRLDARQLDAKQLVAELAAQGHNDYARVTALQALATAKRRAARLEQALLARTAKDPDLKEVLIDAPARAWKEWAQLVEANRAALAAAQAHEDKFFGPRKSAAKGCLAATHAALAGFVRAANSRDDIALLQVATSPIGARLLEAARSCNQIEGRALVTTALAEVAHWGLPRRGPRFLMHVAMGEALSKILADRPRFPLEGAVVAADLTGPVETGEANVPELNWMRVGKVAAVTKSGERVVVTFKTEKWTEDERECKETGRIALFSSDGTPVYHRDCRNTGNKVERSSTAEPFWTWATMASGIAPGTFVRYRTGTTQEGGVFEGIPVDVWASRERKQLIAVMGMPAK